MFVSAAGNLHVSRVAAEFCLAGIRLPFDGLLVVVPEFSADTSAAFLRAPCLQVSRIAADLCLTGVRLPFDRLLVVVPKFSADAPTTLLRTPGFQISRIPTQFRLPRVVSSFNGSFAIVPNFSTDTASTFIRSSGFDVASITFTLVVESFSPTLDVPLISGYSSTFALRSSYQNRCIAVVPVCPAS